MVPLRDLVVECRSLLEGGGSRARKADRQRAVAPLPKSGERMTHDLWKHSNSPFVASHKARSRVGADSRGGDPLGKRGTADVHPSVYRKAVGKPLPSMAMPAWIRHEKER